MTTTPAARRDGASLVSELMSWFGNVPTQPEIRVEEYQERVLTLPAGTKPDDITAEYADGVLTVSMPAATQAAAPQKIPVTHRELPVE